MCRIRRKDVIAFIAFIVFNYRLSTRLPIFRARTQRQLIYGWVKTMSRRIFAVSPKNFNGIAKHPARVTPSLSSISSFFLPTGRNVNRGRDILQRGHGVRAWNQFKSCSPGRDREARERERSFSNLIFTYLAQTYSFPAPLTTRDFYFNY